MLSGRKEPVWLPKDELSSSLELDAARSDEPFLSSEPYSDDLSSPRSSTFPYHSNSSLNSTSRPGRRFWSKRVLVGTVATLFVLAAAGGLLSSPDNAAAARKHLEKAGSHLGNAACYVQGKLGMECTVGAGSANADLMSEPPTHYVPVWTSDRFPAGFVKEEVPVPAAAKAAKNVTTVQAVMRTAVIDTHPWWEGWVMLRLVASIYDLPITDDRHVGLSGLFWDNWDQYELRASVPKNISNPDTDSNGPNVVLGKSDFKDGRDIQFAFPADLFNITDAVRPADGSDTGDVVIPLKFEIFWEKKLLNTFNFELRQKWIPYAKMAICMKPLFGEAVPKMFVEWREHHRQLGFPLVHWSSRTPQMGKAIQKLNELTGGYDTFDHTPLFQEAENDNPWWDEMQTFNECYVRYKQASEFIAVHDLDELLAPHTDFPWTKEFIHEYLTVNWTSADPDAASLQMPMTWVDKKRYGQMPDSRFLDVDPTLSAKDVSEMQQLLLTTDGIVEKHDWKPAYIKSLHRSAKARGANIHWGWPGPSTEQSPYSLIIYHARREQFWPKSEYHAWPLENKSIVAHWTNLVRRIRRLDLNSVYRTDVTSGNEV